MLPSINITVNIFNVSLVSGSQPMSDVLKAAVFSAPGIIGVILRPWRWGRLIREKCAIADDESLRAGLLFWWGWEKEAWRERRHRKSNRPLLSIS